jgi:hypothetical protein
MCGAERSASLRDFRSMLRSTQVLALVLVAAALAFALAHAAEFPGKLRLDEGTYRAVQRIYYPGFTVGGAAEPLAILALIVLLVLTPRTSSAFGWTAAALVAVVGMQAVYWLMTHPANAVWLQGEDLRGGAGTFFGLGAGQDSADWTRLRDRWEYSHVIRSGLALVGFVCLALAATARNPAPQP